MIAAIDAAKARATRSAAPSRCVARGVPPGLGSYAQWDRRLDGRLAQALMSIPAIKAVEIGARRRGRLCRRLRGARRDPAARTPGRRSSTGLSRPTNHAGGLEGGVTNGEEIRVTAT